MKRFLLIGFAAALILSACGASMAASPESEGGQFLAFNEGIGGGAPMEAPAAAESFAQDAGGGPGKVESAAIDRIVIERRFEHLVDDVKLLWAIQRMAEELGGRLVYSTLTGFRPQREKVRRAR
jgi:hypothetical protein